VTTNSLFTREAKTQHQRRASIAGASVETTYHEAACTWVCGAFLGFRLPSSGVAKFGGAAVPVLPGCWGFGVWIAKGWFKM
jgi:hypothetical protein